MLPPASPGYIIRITPFTIVDELLFCLDFGFFVAGYGDKLAAMRAFDGNRYFDFQSFCNIKRPSVAVWALYFLHRQVLSISITPFCLIP